jgi:hypothetical protein
MVMSARETSEIVGKIYSANGRQPTTEQFEAWHDCIREVDPDVAVKAAKEMMRTEDGFPTVAKYLSYVEKFYAGAAPSLESASTEVLATILAVGSYGTPTWSHPAIGAAVNSIGWRDICASEGDYWKAWFARAYENTRKVHTTEHRTEITSGIRVIDTSGLFAIEDKS